MPSEGTHRWPAVGYESRPWMPAPDLGASRRAQLRARGPYRAAVPPFIGEREAPRLPADLMVETEDATIQLSRFDAELGSVTAPFAAILLRSESASSSEIEQLTAMPRAIALAELGGRAGPNAQLVVANARAMEAAIELSGQLDPAAIITMQRELLAETRPELTGHWRRSQVWIGGGAISPHTASFVPPHHERVESLMDDLMRFARRLDWPALPQIALAHAQFETIHPFPDGNGRTGRALVHAMLHRLGITRQITVPVSAGLLRDTRGYFAALTAYREGDPVPIIAAFTRACADALANGRQLVTDLQAFRAWAYDHTSARRNSAGWRLIDVIMWQPVINAATAAGALGVTAQNAQLGIDRMVADGILEQTGSTRRNRTYQAPRVLAALDDFALRARRGR